MTRMRRQSVETVDASIRQRTANDDSQFCAAPTMLDRTEVNEGVSIPTITRNEVLNDLQMTVICKDYHHG